MNRKTYKQHEYYYCFSYPQNNYLQDLGFFPVEESYHHNTGKMFWKYASTNELKVALKAWTWYSGIIRKLK